MGKRKYSPDWIISRVIEYLDGRGSYRSIAKTNGISPETLRRWVAQYQANGENAFIKEIGCNHYSGDFKIRCVETVIRGELSVTECTAYFGISSETVLRDWISKYNANRALKDFNPNQEVYMAEARRKTTIEERKEIVKYCIEHDRDYKNTASLYDVSYSQVYSWVRKYDANGEEALVDKRGHHKTDDEVGELERLRRENLRLKRQLEEKDMLVTLLKKVKEFERM